MPKVIVTSADELAELAKSTPVVAVRREGEQMVAYTVDETTPWTVAVDAHGHLGVILWVDPATPLGYFAELVLDSDREALRRLAMATVRAHGVDGEPEPGAYDALGTPEEREAFLAWLATARTLMVAVVEVDHAI